MTREKDVEVTVEIKKKRNHRSIFQNAYYFGVVVTMAEERLRELGHEVDKNTVHEFFKGKFLYSELVDESGEIHRIPKKTSELTKSEFMEYLEDCKRFCAEILDIYIPDPNEQLEIE